MRNIKDEVSLQGKLETISMMEFRSRPGEVISSVELGKVFIIEKNGKPLAVLSRLPTMGHPSTELSLGIDRKGNIVGYRIT